MKISLDVSAVPERPAGAGRYALELARWLSGANDIELHLFARTNDHTRWSEIAPSSEIHALVPASRPMRLAWEQISMPSQVDRIRPALHLGPHYTVPERASAPKIATIHDMFFFDNPEWHQRSKVPVFRRAIKRATKVADHLVCVSEHTERALRSHFGDVRATTIPLAVDHDRFNTANHADGEIENLGLPANFIVFVGTIEPRKNLPGLLRAFDRIASQHDDLGLVIAGKTGWKNEEFEQTIATMQHGNRIVRTGYVSDAVIRSLLINARAVAYPSFAEGFGLPALEALACGAALVTSADSAMSEVVGDAAVLVNPYDDDSITNGLVSALAGGPDIESMRQRGPQVAADYTWDRTGEAHLRLIQSVVAARA